MPDGTDAVAEPLQVSVDVGLADHVVAHPEERVLLPQPLLLEKVAERVEQCGKWRVEEPAHKHGGLAHVRRVPRPQPLAYGVPVLLLPAGDEVLVNVAVERFVLGELGLAPPCPTPCSPAFPPGSLGVDLPHSVARQLC
eukprot:scaffold97252_cov64-Phaeocystis_antarctica.AAC.4